MLSYGTNPIPKTSYFGNITTFCARGDGIGVPEDTALDCLSAGLSLGKAEGSERWPTTFHCAAESYPIWTVFRFPYFLLELLNIRAPPPQTSLKLRDRISAGPTAELKSVHRSVTH
jgi:hypothetical protein